MALTEPGQGSALDRLVSVTGTLTTLQRDDPDLALANATLYLDAFGCITAGRVVPMTS